MILVTPQSVRGDGMLRQEVRSSELLLEVEFHSGEIYRYFDVPAWLVLELLEAESIGRFFNARIRSKFKFEEVR